MINQPIRRRRILAGAAALAGGATVAYLPESAQAAPVGGGVHWRGRTSLNGWPIIAEATRYRIEGTDHWVRLAPAASTLLLHCLRRYHYEIDSSVRADEIVGHTRSRRVAVDYESNQLSGSAVTIRPAWYPLDATDGMFEHEVVIVRDILADCQGVVRWGRDETRPKESHFQIDVAPHDPTLRTASATLAQQTRTPGEGPGSAVDPFSTQRLRRAQTVRRQARSR